MAASAPPLRYIKLPHIQSRESTRMHSAQTHQAFSGAPPVQAQLHHVLHVEAAVGHVYGGNAAGLMRHKPERRQTRLQPRHSRRRQRGGKDAVRRVTVSIRVLRAAHARSRGGSRQYRKAL